MKKAYFLFALLAALFVSCQKDISLDAQNTTVVNELLRGDENGELLVRMVSVSIPGSDSIVQEYQYDSAKQLAQESFSAISTQAGATKIYSSITRFYRDASERVVKVAQKYGQPVEGIVYDTTFTYITYQNAGSKKIMYTITITKSGSKTAYDSTVYFYGTNNRVNKTQHFTGSIIDSLSVTPKSQVYFTWQYESKGNLTKIEQFSDNNNNGNFELMISYEFKYDDKINPLFAQDDVRMEGGWGSVASPNNVLEQKVTPAGIGAGYTHQWFYQYQINNRPATERFTSGDVGSRVTTAKYYYK